MPLLKHKAYHERNFMADAHDQFIRAKVGIGLIVEADWTEDGPTQPVDDEGTRVSRAALDCVLFLIDHEQAWAGLPRETKVPGFPLEIDKWPVEKFVISYELGYRADPNDIYKMGKVFHGEEYSLEQDEKPSIAIQEAFDHLRDFVRSKLPRVEFDPGPTSDMMQYF
jgi:hypothetical protein